MQAKTEPDEELAPQAQGTSASRGSPTVVTIGNDSTLEAQGDNEQPEAKHPSIFPQHQAAGVTHGVSRDPSADLNATAGDDVLPTAGSAKDLQEGEAGESTPNLEGSARAPAGHMDHGLPAEGLRMHFEPGTLEKVSGRGVGRGANNAANSHQALNKKVQTT